MQPKTTTLLFLTAVIFSCSRSNFYEHQSLSNLPSQAHNRDIEVFYEDDQQPERDYIEFYDLRLVKKGSFNDRQMITFLKQEAQKKGLDGVTQVKKWDESEERTTLIDLIASIGDDSGYDPTTTVNHSIIEAKGIKYVENIDLSRSVKTGKVIDETTGLEVGAIHYLPNGLIIETESVNDEADLLMEVYYLLSEDHLLHEQKDWQTLHHHDGRIDVRRKYRMNDWVLKRVRVKHDTYHKRIRAIRLTENPDQNPIYTKLAYFYNKAGQLTERRATGARNLIEKLQYTAGKLSSRSIEYAGKRFVVQLNYYQQEDLKGLIRKVG